MAHGGLGFVVGFFCGKSGDLDSSLCGSACQVGFFQKA